MISIASIGKIIPLGLNLKNLSTSNTGAVLLNTIVGTAPKLASGTIRAMDPPEWKQRFKAWAREVRACYLVAALTAIGTCILMFALKIPKQQILPYLLNDMIAYGVGEGLSRTKFFGGNPIREMLMQKTDSKSLPSPSLPSFSAAPALHPFQQAYQSTPFFDQLKAVALEEPAFNHAQTAGAISGMRGFY